MKGNPFIRSSNSLPNDKSASKHKKEPSKLSALLQKLRTPPSSPKIIASLFNFRAESKAESNGIEDTVLKHEVNKSLMDADVPPPLPSRKEGLKQNRSHREHGQGSLTTPPSPPTESQLTHPPPPPVRTKKPTSPTSTSSASSSDILRGLDSKVGPSPRNNQVRTLNQENEDHLEGNALHASDLKIENTKVQSKDLTGWMQIALKEFKTQYVKDRKYRFKTYKNAFVGRELLDFLTQLPMEDGKSITRSDALDVCKKLCDSGAIAHVTGEHDFKDDNLFYQFVVHRRHSSNGIRPPLEFMLHDSSQTGQPTETLDAETPKSPLSSKPSVPEENSPEQLLVKSRDEAKHVNEAKSEAKLTVHSRQESDSFYNKGDSKSDNALVSARTKYAVDPFPAEDEKNKEFSYESMIHQFPTAERQARAGIFNLKRIGKFLNKQAEILKGTSSDKKKVYAYEMQKSNECRQDRMTEHLVAMEGMYAVEHELEVVEDRLRKEIGTKIVEPAFKFAEEANKLMDDIVKQERSKSAALQADALNLAESRKACLKKYKELKQIHDKLKSSSSLKLKDRQLLEKKKKKALETATKYFNKTEVMEREYNHNQVKYRHTWLPEQLLKMRNLDFERLKLQKDLLERHCRLRLQYITDSASAFNKFNKLTFSLDAQRDLNNCCEKWELQYGFPPPLKGRTPLPCTSEDLQSDRWMDIMENVDHLTLSDGAEFGKQPIINTPIDKTTTLEAENEEWFRATVDHIPHLNSEIKLDPDDIIHVLKKNPPALKKLLVTRSLRMDDSVAIVVMKSAKDRPASPKASVEDLENSVDAPLEQYQRLKTANYGSVNRIYEQDGIRYCEILIKSEDGNDIKEIFMQEVIPESVYNKLTGVKNPQAQVLYDYVADSTDRYETLKVKKGEKIIVLRKTTLSDDFVHAKSENGGEGIVPVNFIESLRSKDRKSSSSMKIALLDTFAKIGQNALEGDMWLGINIRNMQRGLFPASAVQSVKKSAKNFGDDEDDDENEDEDKPLGKQSKGFLTDMIKSTVSKKKRRYVRDGYNLDLSYITTRIIAMGFPSTGIEAKYRNDIADVIRFFQEKHQGQYWIWNLCVEKGRDYDKTKFENCVTRLGFPDHNPCLFKMIEPFCRELRLFFKRKPAGVAAIHCKAGKGRTGFLISCYFIYAHQWFTADRALRFFAVKRTKNQKGVTIPSQRRYVGYFERYLRHKRKEDGKAICGEKIPLPPKYSPIPDSRIVKLMRISLLPIPQNCKSDSVYFTVWTPTEEDLGDPKRNVWKSKGNVKCERRPAQDYLLFTSGQSGMLRISDDAKFTFTCESGFLTKTQKLFHFWLNTRFLHPIPGKPGFFEYTLFKAELDKACKDKKHEIFADAFRVEMEFFLDD